MYPSEEIFGKGEFFILKANGESIVEAGIEDGDLVIVRKQKKLISECV